MIRIIFINFVFLQIFGFYSEYFYSQSKSEIENFFKDQASLICSLAHKNSTFIGSEIEVIDSDDIEYEYKVIVTINYKGFIKNHNLKSFIYFENYPRKFVWGSDTNTFKINTEPDIVIEELKYKWNKFLQGN